MAQHGSAQKKEQPSSISSFISWLRLKKYQYEVTLPLYMLTPTERYVFTLVIFILFSMFVAAAYLYLPNHVMTIYNRVYYYVVGDFYNIGVTASGPTSQITQLIKGTQAVPIGGVTGTITNSARHAREL